jgi:excisionase family DNA binding protein
MHQRRRLGTAVLPQRSNPRPTATHDDIALDDLRQRTYDDIAQKARLYRGNRRSRSVFSSIGSDASVSASQPSEPLTRADVLTAAEASRLLGIPRSTLYTLARRNELPARQIGRRWIFRRSLLERATLPLTEPDCWQRTLGSTGANRVVEMSRPLPANVARSARNR